MVGGKLGGNLTFAARFTDVRYAQKVYFAKSHEWPKITVRVSDLLPGWSGTAEYIRKLASEYLNRP
jgi:hypothetical protein